MRKEQLVRQEERQPPETGITETPGRGLFKDGWSTLAKASEKSVREWPPQPSTLGRLAARHVSFILVTTKPCLVNLIASLGSLKVGQGRRVWLGGSG